MKEETGAASRTVNRWTAEALVAIQEVTMTFISVHVLVDLHNVDLVMAFLWQLVISCYTSSDQVVVVWWELVDQ